jgi:hypothetical protein
MRQWVLYDRDGREIYLTEEQWAHIISGHRELCHHLDDVLNTIRQGRRRQQPTDPNSYVYQLRCDSLRPPYNGIMVVVAFRFNSDEQGKLATNNFVVTAWGIIIVDIGE